MLSNDQYVEKIGAECPNCHSENLSMGKMQTDADFAWMEVECLDCKALRNDVYNLVGYSSLMVKGKYTFVPEPGTSEKKNV